MIYREYLVMRKALVWFAVLVALMMIVLVSTERSATIINYAEITNAAGWLAAIFASIFGVALGNGSREAARVLWVLPTKRWHLALQVIIVDLVGMTAAFACVFLLYVGSHLGARSLGPLNAADVTLALVMTYATYGWSALVGMIGRRVAYSGIIVLPALMVWIVLGESQRAIGQLVRAAIVMNPFAVFNAGTILADGGHSSDPIVSSLQWLGTGGALPVLIATTLATCTVATLLWQRAQAISA